MTSPSSPPPASGTITLVQPLTRPGNAPAVTSVALRMPTVGDQLAAERGGGGDIEKEIRLLGNLAALTHDEMVRLSLADYRQMQEALQRFLSLRPTTSAAPSPS